MPAKPELTDIELDKLEIDPDLDFKEIGSRPFYDLTTNEIGMFKWSGVYHQLQRGFFMIRLRLPGGLITADQMDRAGELAEQYGQSQLCITTRQTFQFHWIRKQDIHKVIEGMEEVGISTRNACGDVTRNVVTCSLQGVCPHEIGDTRNMLDLIADDREILNEQRNLPRKHKISVAGCGRSCGQTLMNCQGWHPVRRFSEDGTEETGWKFHAGGGLGPRPFMAKAIFDWVPEDLVLEITRAVTEVFRRKGNRRVRAYARLKMVVDKLGSRGFGNAVLEVLKERRIEGLDRIEHAISPDADVGATPHEGKAVVPQRQEGFSVVRVMILRSEVTSQQCRQFAAWSRRYGNGEIMLTNRQNLELRFVPNDQVEALLKEIHDAGFRTTGHERAPDMVACVGTTQCNLAVSDTPNTYRTLYRELADDKELWEQVGSLRIHMNGCPNSCAQHWIADIGLRGNRRREEVGSAEGFGLFVGGSLRGPGHIAQHVCDVRSDEAAGAIRRLLEVYVEHREDEQSFGEFVRRTGMEKLRLLMGSFHRLEEPVNLRNLKLESLYGRAIEEVGS